MPVCVGANVSGLRWPPAKSKTGTSLSISVIHCLLTGLIPVILNYCEWLPAGKLCGESTFTKVSDLVKTTPDKLEGRQDPSTEFTLSAIERAQGKSPGYARDKIYKGRVLIPFGLLFPAKGVEIWREAINSASDNFRR